MPTTDPDKLARLHRELHQHLPPDPELRVRALESLLLAKGLVDAASVERFIEAYQHEIGPQNGAKVVARAWVDPDYRRRLLEDGTAAIAVLGYSGQEGAQIVVLENTPQIHNLVVCTLCSCYPWPVLGLPPAWYKSTAYRSRAVSDPRGVLEEFGLALDPEVELRVWDSTAVTRYLVLPEPPADTQNLNETELAGLVTRNSMIGTERL